MAMDGLYPRNAGAISRVWRDVMYPRRAGAQRRGYVQDVRYVAGAWMRRSDDGQGWNDKKQFYLTDVGQPYFSLVGKVSKRTPRSFGLRHTARDTLFLKLIRIAQTVNCSCINGIHAIHGNKSASCLRCALRPSMASA